MTELNLSRSPDACWGYIESSGERHLALWSPKARRLHLLNDTAAAVWALLEGPRDARTIASMLAGRYGVDEAFVGADISPVLMQLIEGQLVVQGQPSTEHVDVSDPDVVLPPTFGNWSLGPLRALGVAMQIDAPDPHLRAALEPILAPLETGPSALSDSDLIHVVVRAVGNSWVIERNGFARSRASSRAQALRAVLAEVNAAPLDVIDDAVVLHAAGVEFVSGNAKTLVVFPGVSNSGKSTMAAQLCLRGHRYLTDEAVAIDTHSGVARAFHKALCVEPTAQLLLSELACAVPEPVLSSTWDIDPREIGAGSLSGGGVADTFVFPTYCDGAAVAFERLQPVDVLQRLIANAFDFGRVGQSAFERLVQIANTTPAFSLVHGGGGSQLDLLEERFGVATEARLLR